MHSITSTSDESITSCPFIPWKISIKMDPCVCLEAQSRNSLADHLERDFLCASGNSFVPSDGAAMILFFFDLKDQIPNINAPTIITPTIIINVMSTLTILEDDDLEFSNFDEDNEDDAIEEAVGEAVKEAVTSGSWRIVT